MELFAFSGVKVEIIKGDITIQKVDAIVNAANRHLQHGAGVAGAILAKGGNIIQQESEDWVNIHGLVTHDHPAITSGGTLPCKYVIHAVGPVWGEGDEHQKLELTVLSSLFAANELKCQTVAIPAISTGVFGFPVQQAAGCFLNAIEKFARSQELIFIQTIRIVLFDYAIFQIFLDNFSSRK